MGVLTVENVAAGGDGVGRLNGLAVFVPRTAPGDVAQVAYRIHGRLGRGRVLQVLTPSTHRVEPRCVHYVNDLCGGCQVQHLDAETQQRSRQEIVRDTLARIGKRTIPLPSIVTGREWGYRTRLTLALRKRGSGWTAGLHRYDDGARVFSLSECAIVEPTIEATWQALRVWVERNQTPLPSAPLLRLSLRLAESRDASGQITVGVFVVVQGGASWPTQDAWRRAVRGMAPRVLDVLWTPADIAAEDVMAPSASEATEAAEARAFAQVNASVADAMHEVVLEHVRTLQGVRVFDGYAGTGRLALALVADAERRVVSVELDPAGVRATEAQRALLPSDAAARLDVQCELVEKALQHTATTAFAPDVVVLNPPRAGVDVRVTKWLESKAASSVRGVVYVSCNPATLARDLSRLPSWRVESVQCFDMFPQTAHVESVCVLQREKP
ncbi:MAG: class I SAM-dependent RNA methyltransferase [Gemmatimonadaceae bacterium]|nr:class I SAM-dependent RNA methyltransferase [Gemmatimonadaceae bacterium]